MRIEELSFRFVQTCEVCPEQYDVIETKTNKLVGYVRLRWGELIATYPDVAGEIIYSHKMNDKLCGCFSNDIIRKFHLGQIANAIAKKMTESSNDSSDDVIKLIALPNGDRILTRNDVVIPETYNKSDEWLAGYIAALTSSSNHGDKKCAITAPEDVDIMISTKPIMYSLRLNGDKIASDLTLNEVVLTKDAIVGNGKSTLEVYRQYRDANGHEYEQFVHCYIV